MEITGLVYAKITIYWLDKRQNTVMKCTEVDMKPLSYLDGMRGIAAFIVVLSHFVQLFYPALLESDIQIAHNPFEMILNKTPFNIFYNGNFSVCIFLY